MAPRVEKDEEFYMTLVTIQVQNRLFRVPREALESRSKVFRDMFSLPQTENADGSSDKNPIRLEGVRSDEFKRFLEVLFKDCYEEPPMDDSVFDRWFPVLKLAQMWECDGIRKQAIGNIPYERVRKSPAEKVALAVGYNITPWLLPGVNELARREEPLAMSDFGHLGPELTLKVAAVRESLTMVLDKYSGIEILAPGIRDASVSRMDFTSVIKRVFDV